ncbi:MAG: DUF3078 domain-containing protein [Candidatus Zixiibacteriota bacterium]|nr:MAG: DUF3078 domain-containing protein [candidate division Zixibacteria bacterium]
MKSFIIVLFSPLFVYVASQAEPWSKSFDTDLTLTQNSYSDSWTGGEAGNVSWVWNANGLFEKQVSPKFKFRNASKFSFGQTHIQDSETKDWTKPKKSTDLIDIENLGLFTLHTYVDPFVGLRFESQFLDASVPGVNLYLNPKKITESAGVARQFYKKEKDELLSRLGFALRQILTEMVIDTLLEETETETTNDGGLESVTDLNLTLSKTLKFTSKLSLYKALFFSESDELEGTPQADYWKAIDINWENRLAAAVSKYITVSLYMQLLYDKQLDKRGRLKETLSLGITYKLF